ncbi:hypothetical protein GOP47_0005157 [Adiantum capillus-veneris]|uniref:Glycosyltransferase n=1 Tax=Adiantum capillus-veneris TaxID=13818 RepID=A0A9D4V4U0_ADICA|nr:hypothetical protein GOP47_0005157 [Adiantum capillus-veneris]
MGQLQLETSPPSSAPCSAPHCLLLPYPAQGHINPLMQLGKRLASHGVRVTVAIIEHIHAKILHAQQGQLMNGLVTSNFQTLPIKDGLPPDFDRENWGPEMSNVVEKTLADGALELVHTLASQGQPVTCIVGDFFLRWTGSVAEKAAVPEFIFWPQNATIFSVYLHVDAIVESGYDPFEENVRAAASREADSMELISCIPGLSTPIHPADLPFECPFGKRGLEWMRDALLVRFNSMGEARGVICNSFEALELHIFKALTLEFQQGAPHPQYNHCWPRSNFRLVGPLVPRAILHDAAEEIKGNVDELRSGGSFWKEEVQECKDWLDAQPAGSVLFVAFGSIMSLSVSQVQEVAKGLEASGQKFLWVLRDKATVATSSEDFDVKPEFVPVEEALPEGFMELQNQQQCKVVSWAPQALVLSHPAVGGFFSHCGWNSTLESLCCGVPLLGWPWLMDQATNCWLASHVWKVGLTLQRYEDNQTSRKFVESGVRRLMEGPIANSLRAKAKHLRALAREAAQRDGDTVLSSLVKEISSQS